MKLKYIILILVIFLLILCLGCLTWLVSASIPEINKTLERPTYSPDGKYILFSVIGNVYLVNRNNTKDIKQITNDGGHLPIFSNDGRKIAYIVYDMPYNFYIWLIDIDRCYKRQIINLKAYCWYIFFSADGLKIYYIRSNENSYEIMENVENSDIPLSKLETYDIYETDIKGSYNKRITYENYKNIVDAYATHDGKYIIFNAEKQIEDNVNLFKLDINNGEINFIYKGIKGPFAITNNFTEIIYLKEDRIEFNPYKDIYYNIYSYNLNDNKIIMLSDKIFIGDTYCNISISNEGKKLLLLKSDYIRQYVLRWDIIEINIDGTDLQNIIIDSKALDNAEKLYLKY